MIVYRERVLPSAANLALPVLLFPSVFAVMLPIQASLALPVATLLTLVFAAILITSCPVIVLTESTLTAKNATIQRKLLGKAQVIPKAEIFEALGQKLDARAWLSIQASVKGLVKIEVLDTNDPTPYWLISTRNPDKLVRELNQ